MGSENEMKISLCITVFNEEKHIGRLLESIAAQTRQPDEVVIVDGGSTDETKLRIKNYELRIKNLKLVTKKGNRAVGRNEAIRQASGDIIAITDAGCELEKKWLEEITRPFVDATVQVVSGYYAGKPQNTLEASLVPYVLVMPDRVNHAHFLPATRSMAMRKSVWEKLGGFPREYRWNEDYVFSKQLEKENIPITFAQKAMVYWFPRETIGAGWRMFYNFARGDAQAGIWRTNVLLLLLRVIAGFYLVGFAFLLKSLTFTLILVILGGWYLLWAIWKNYRYTLDPKALIFLPLWQLTADSAVFIGTLQGVFDRCRKIHIQRFLREKRVLLGIIGIYIVLVLSQLFWGVPSRAHPFIYHMDEWHQLMAVRGVFSQGSANIAGAAHGTMLQFVLSGIYLIPFYLTGIINPFHLTSAVSDLDLQGRLFVILRLNTMFFGIGGSIVFWQIVKRFFSQSPVITTLFFIFTPVFLMLSNYFKYDVALLFWILVAFYCMLLYGKRKSFNSFLLAGIVTGLALATKISALPLILCYAGSYFLFTDKRLWKGKDLLGGMLVMGFVTIVFGIPDIFVRWHDYYDHLYVNVVAVPSGTADFLLPLPVWPYLLAIIYPMLFGYPVLISAVFGILLLVIMLVKGKIQTASPYVFMFGSFVIFALSLLPLQIFASGNRALVLLPFLAVFAGYFWQFLYTFSKKEARYLVFFCFTAMCILQGFLVFLWMHLKYAPDPRAASSVWLSESIPENTTIGIENIPIYQYLPDVILKEYYLSLENTHQNTQFSYAVIDVQTEQSPKVVIITNSVEADMMTDSPKKRLVNRLLKEGYKHMKTFPINREYLRFFGSEKDFYFTALVSTVPIDIYQK